jgi:hypothetical protein
MKFSSPRNLQPVAHFTPRVWKHFVVELLNLPEFLSMKGPVAWWESDYSA